MIFPFKKSIYEPLDYKNQYFYVIYHANQFPSVVPNIYQKIKNFLL